MYTKWHSFANRGCLTLNDVPSTLPFQNQMNLNNKGLSTFIILPGDTPSLPR